MSQLKSIALTALLGFGVAGLSGYLACAIAEPVKPPAAKVYAQGAGWGGERPTKPTEDFAKAQDRNPWTITSPLGADIRSRAGFVGYH